MDLLSYGSFFLINALIFSIMALGLNLQWGQTGLFNAGLAGFVAVGAYTSGLLTTPETVDRLGGFDMPILVGWAGAAVVAGLASAFTGYATLRLKADYLAITTFGVAAVVQLVALNAGSLTGGPLGMAFIPRPFASFASTPLLFNLLNLLVVAVMTLLIYLLLEYLARSPWGRVLTALREDERAAISLGKNTRSYRIQAFAVGGAIMGLAGAIQAHFIGFIAPDNYLPPLTFQIWVMLIVGGAGSNRGAIIGTILVWAIWAGSGAAISQLVPTDQQARAASLQLVLIGVLLCTVLLVKPSGLFGPRPRKQVEDGATKSEPGIAG